MLETALSSMNIRIDEEVKSVAKLKASLQYSQQDVDDLIESVGWLASKTKLIRSCVF